MKNLFFLFIVVAIFSSCDKDQENSKQKDVVGEKLYLSNQIEEIEVSSLFDNYGYSTISLSRSEDGFVNVVTDVTEAPDDAKSLLYYYDYSLELGDSFNQLTIPSENQAVWIIPFDPDKVPMQVGGGGSGSGSSWVRVSCRCDCEGAGDCALIITNGTTYTCDPATENPCSGCCDQTTTIGGIVNLDLNDTYILISAEEVNFNGVLYQSENI